MLGNTAQGNLESRTLWLLGEIDHGINTDGSVSLAIGVTDMSKVDEVKKALSKYGTPSSYNFKSVPLFYITIPNRLTANNLIKEYDQNRNEGYFKYIDHIDVNTPDYELTSGSYKHS